MYLPVTWPLLPVTWPLLPVTWPLLPVTWLLLQVTWLLLPVTWLLLPVTSQMTARWRWWCSTSRVTSEKLNYTPVIKQLNYTPVIKQLNKTPVIKQLNHTIEWKTVCDLEKGRKFFVTLKKVKVKIIDLVHNFIILAICWNHDPSSMLNGSLSYDVQKMTPIQVFCDFCKKTFINWPGRCWRV